MRNGLAYAICQNVILFLRGGGGFTGRAHSCITSSSENIVQEPCESRGGRPGLSILTGLLASVDVKIY